MQSWIASWKAGQRTGASDALFKLANGSCKHLALAFVLAARDRVQRHRLAHVDQKSHYGCCSDQGVFEANLPKKFLQKSPGNFRFVWAPKGARAGNAVDVRGLPLEVRVSAEVSSESLGA